jgi:hypothetical protein
VKVVQVFALPVVFAKAGTGNPLPLQKSANIVNKIVNKDFRSSRE